MVIYILLLTELLLLGFCYFAFEKDFFAPPFICCLGFTVSTMAAMYNITRWSIDLSWTTYAVVIGGLAVFVGTAYAVERGFRHRDRVLSRTGGNGLPHRSGAALEEIPLNLWLVGALLLAMVVIAVVYYSNVIRIANAFVDPSSSYLVKMQVYRQEASYGILDASLQMPKLVIWGFQFMNACGYVIIYVLVNNFLAGKWKKPANAMLLVVLLISYAASLLSSGRTTLVYYPLAAVVIYSILWHRKHGWDKTFGLKFIGIMALVLVAVIVIFVVTRNLVGRNDHQDPIYYLSIYFGGPIPLLDLFLKEPPEASAIWGKETFGALNSFIGRFFNLEDLVYVWHKEFREANGLRIGNVYTCFRSWIYDFGYPGLVILSAVQSAFFAAFYNLLKRKRARKRIELSVVIYGYLFYSVALMFYCEWFFTDNLAPIFLKYVFFMAVAAYAITFQRSELKLDTWKRRGTALREQIFKRGRHG